MKLKLVCQICLLLLLALPIQAEETLHIEDAWISEGPPVIKVNAAYFLMKNSGQAATILIAITSPEYARIEMHRTIIVDGTAKMESQKAIDIPAGQSLEFKPGGYHLMLYEPKEHYKAGEQIPLLFKFSDGQTLEVNAEVRKLSVEHSHHHHHH